MGRDSRDLTLKKTLNTKTVSSQLKKLQKIMTGGNEETSNICFHQKKKKSKIELLLRIDF
jgi:hypothetical protein